mgnify:CR=1 FL=1
MAATLHCERALGQARQQNKCRYIESSGRLEGTARFDLGLLIGPVIWMLDERNFGVSENIGECGAL